MRNDLNKKKKMVGFKKKSKKKITIVRNDAPCEEVPMIH